MKRQPSAPLNEEDSGNPETAVGYDCLICTSAIDVFGVFDCGHYCCAICALRIFRFGKSNAERCCPMCRAETKDVKVVTLLPHDEWCFDMEKLRKLAFYRDKVLRVSVESREVTARLEKLYSFLCPLEECWNDGTQEPFTTFNQLKDHLRHDHGLKYCPLCIEHRPSFLCEQLVYTEGEFDQHCRGKCTKDLHSFFGHPVCLFCRTRHYDGDYLLKHMQSDHFTCDVCNRGEFTFVFYRNRAKLLEHFSAEHKVCQHPECAELDPMLRVFASELELLAHEQKVHRAATRAVPLESLGFNYGGRGSRPERQSPQPAPAHATAEPTENPATGRDVHAATIWFDQVGRKEAVNTMPRTVHRTSVKEVREREQELRLASQVIPAHYEPPEVRERTLAALALRQSSRTEEKASDAPPPPDPVDRPSVPDNLTPAEYNAMLQEKLAHVGRAQFEELKRLSTEFLANRLMATEYYRALGSVFTRPQLEDIFEPLAYSLTNETKRAALIAARAMMNSKEERDRLDAERRAAEEKLKADRIKAKQTLGGWKPPAPAAQTGSGSKPVVGLPVPTLSSAARGAANAKSKKSVWAERSEGRKAAGVDDGASKASGASGLASAVPPSLMAEVPTAAIPTALLQHRRQPATNYGPLHIDPDDFPALEGPKGTKPPAPKPAKKGGASGNAWFRN